ncbi:MAG: CTP-dependent riboflavin kinase [Candidatus ainarchaeum sp.]|nr:CTP-dependent riboflavin kinase [Candidatus ainarchaeum sp.]
MDELLLLLAKKGALASPVRLTTSEIGQLLGMSQQNASVRLRSLEKEGMLERKAGSVVLTARSESALRSEFSDLKGLFEGGSILLRGKVVKGFSEGSFFISLPGYRKAIEEKLGFTPYPGTLNLELIPEHVERRLELRSRAPIEITGFSHRGKTYGPIEAYRCRVGGIDGAVVFPRRSQHGLSIIEVIAPVYLLGELKLGRGSLVDVEVFPG